jgi:hypothetical protein
MGADHLYGGFPNSRGFSHQEPRRLYYRQWLVVSCSVGGSRDIYDYHGCASDPSQLAAGTLGIEA